MTPEATRIAAPPADGAETSSAQDIPPGSHTPAFRRNATRAPFAEIVPRSAEGPRTTGGPPATGRTTKIQRGFQAANRAPPGEKAGPLGRSRARPTSASG